MKACIDIGGTKVAVSLAREGSRTLLGRLAEPTAKTGDNDALARQILRMIDQACAGQGVSPDRIGAVGVSACGPFALNGGMVELTTPNICGGMSGDRDAAAAPNTWRTALLEAPLRERFARVRVENDAVAALEAERHWGALQGHDHCAYVTWSTGVGVGLCVDGHVLRGKNGNAGHAGHSFVDGGGAQCGCGNVGDVEGLAAGSAIARRFGRAPAEVLAAAAKGDAQALFITDALCRTMGRMLYNLVATLDLQCISLGGSVFWNHRELLLQRLQTHIDGHLPSLTIGVRLVPAGLGDEIGDLAALALTY